MTLLGGWTGAIFGSQFEIQSPAVYGEIGLLLGAASGMAIGLSTAVGVRTRGRHQSA
jgi:hypothetical protein